ncbi:MAG TPA: PucR family transcriptional regulator [Marmoricola sp.]|nr:PucR family transcriptional regulator [Marmoricola sp.]
MPVPTVASLCDRLGDDLTPVPGFTPPATEVSAVHISELLDPTGYLNGGELLLTTGLAMPKSKLGCDRYVRRLKEAGVSALAIGLGPVHTSPPGPLIDACQKFDLALLSVPGPTPFQVITKTYWSAVSRVTEQRLNDVLAAHRALVNAAASPDPVAAVLRSLSRAMNGWAAVMGPQGGIEQVYPLRMLEDAELVRGEISRLQVAGIHSAASFEAAGHVVVVFPLAVEKRVVGYLAVGSPATLDAPQRRVVLTACALLSIDAVLRQRHESARAATHRCVATLVDLGMVDAARRLAAEVQAPLIGEECLVLVLRSRDSDEAANLVRHWCAESLAVGVDAHVAWFLVPIPHRPLLELEKAIRASDPAAAAILSEPVRLELAGPVRVRMVEALDSLHPGEVILRSSSVRRHGTSLATSLDQLITREPQELVTALAGYLKHHGNWEQASRALGIHRNTLRHRIGRCTRALGVDLDDPDVSAELWLSMRARGVA